MRLASAVAMKRCPGKLVDSSRLERCTADLSPIQDLKASTLSPS